MAEVKTHKESKRIVLVVSATPKQNRVNVQVQESGARAKSVTAVVFSKALAEKLDHALEERLASSG